MGGHTRSSGPLLLETVTRSIPEGLNEIRVTRGGTVDWHYLPYDEDREPDLRIYDDDGEILSPFDEFNAQYGGAFCGYEELSSQSNLPSEQTSTRTTHAWISS